ncbi:hypothetical protein MKZ38_010221 [Zalerion maritima]|uniref:Uncharacterized protein n=1 Tax=Zalerion maritima TaxID=339359 RepID=A0AAD5RGF0_9PEZI|nr:hypothetical protein MKZ38_010221 [Zalerion maritima]
MDFVNKFTGGSEGKKPEQSSDKKEEGGSFFDQIGNKVNEAAGGGKKSEKDEDMLDKGVDFIQEKFLGAGPQDNENAAEQAKDEQISDMVRKQYKSATGQEFPIKDKDKNYGV